MGDETDDSSGVLDGRSAEPGGDRVASVLSMDRVFEVLSHPRRRYLCYVLLDADEWSLADLAAEIAAWEADTSADDVADDRWREVCVSLYHAHLPALVEEDVVTFDRSTGTITRAENAGEILTALEALGAEFDGDADDGRG
jgi:hypothetical protein